MKQFMPDASQTERLHALQQAADKTESGAYIKVLTDDEIMMRRELLSDSAIELNRLEEEKKDIISQLKEKMEPVKKGFNQLLMEIKTGQIECKGNTYLMADHEAGMMEYYDEMGELVKSRRLRPEEKQTKIFQIPGTLNDFDDMLLQTAYHKIKSNGTKVKNFLLPH